MGGLVGWFVWFVLKKEVDSFVLEFDDRDLRLVPIERDTKLSEGTDGWDEPMASTQDDDGCAGSTENSPKVRQGSTGP